VAQKPDPAIHHQHGCSRSGFGRVRGKIVPSPWSQDHKANKGLTDTLEMTIFSPLFLKNFFEVQMPLWKKSVSGKKMANSQAQEAPSPEPPQKEAGVK